MSSTDGTIGQWKHRTVVLNGETCHYVEAGSGPLVVLLHGFPEFWYSWRHQITALSSSGFHVIAPDLRGYNDSGKPPGVRAYRMETLVEDVAALVRHVGSNRASIAGHDWGGVIAWNLAMQMPALLERLIVLNAPHPAAFLRELGTFSQLLRSWYIFFFQLPALPEWSLRAGNYAKLEATLRQEPLHPGAFSGQEIACYKKALSRPGALSAAINYYRAAFRSSARRLTVNVSTIAVPTLLIWGEQDRYLRNRLTEGLEPWVPGLRIERLPNASHWVQNDEPEQVNRLMLEFLMARE